MSDKKAAPHHFRSSSPPCAFWEHSSTETESNSFHIHCVSISELLASAKHEPGFCFFLSLGKQNDQVPQICEQIPNGQLNEKAKNATQKCPPESEVKKSYNVGHLFSKFSSIYSDTSCQVFKKSWFFKQIKYLVSLCEKNAQRASFIKSLPFIKKMQLNLDLGGKNDSHLEDEIRTFDTNISPGRLVRKGETMTFLSSKASVNGCATGHVERPCSYCRNETLETSFVLRQNFVNFSDLLLKLQLCPLDDLLQHVTCILPEVCGRPDELRGVYWIAVGSCTKPEPEPACLLLFSTVMYALVLSASELQNSQDSLDIFYVLPMTALREIQIGFAGQNIRLLCYNEDNVMKVYTFNQTLTQRICYDILSLVISSSDYDCLNHQLLKDDLLQLSLDWTLSVTDLVFENGVKLSCSFETHLADLAYLLHENMEIHKPPLGEIQILFFTVVKVEGEIRSLVLTNTHIGLVQEDSVSFSVPKALYSLTGKWQMDRIQLRCLSELRCMVVPEKDNLTEIELVFSKASQVGCGLDGNLSCGSQRVANTQRNLVSFFCHTSPSVQTHIWKLTFSSNKDAVRLMLHLME